MAIDTDKLQEFLGRFIADLGATVAAGNVVIGHRLGRKEQARAELDRAAWLAGEHGLPHVLRDAQEGLRLLR